MLTLGKWERSIPTVGPSFVHLCFTLLEAAGSSGRQPFPETAIKSSAATEKRQEVSWHVVDRFLRAA